MNARPDVADHPARVLIVDDERHNRTLVERMLTPEGFVLLTAASGEEALAVVAQRPPDLILLDVMMPGMNGYQVASKIKGNLATKNIPVIMVTALNDRHARMLGLSAGAEDFLTKPVDRAELCVRVRNLLRLKAYGDYYDKYSQRLEGEVVSRTADLIGRTKTLEQQAAVLIEQAALLDLAQDAIIVRDMHSRIVFWSRGAEVMYGWPSKEAVGRDTHELFKTEFSEPTEQVEAKLLRHGRWEGEAIHHKRDGTALVVASRLALQCDADGAPVRILAINNDITDRSRPIPSFCG
jgi:PAS domain S-box-containing protein